MHKVLDFLGLLISPISDHFKHKTELKKITKQAEVQIATAKATHQITQAQKGQQADIELDRISLASRGWKDEFILLVVFIPIILSFIPSMVPYVSQGFQALSITPEYYWYIVGAVVIDTLGFRRLLRGVLEAYTGRLLNRR